MKLLPLLCLALVGCAHGWNGKSTLRVERPDKTTVSYENAASKTVTIDTQDPGLQCKTIIQGPTEPGRFMLYCDAANSPLGASALGDCAKGPNEVNFAASYNGKHYFMEMLCK